MEVERRRVERWVGHNSTDGGAGPIADLEARAVGKGERLQCQVPRTLSLNRGEARGLLNEVVEKRKAGGGAFKVGVAAL